MPASRIGNSALGRHQEHAKRCAKHRMPVAQNASPSQPAGVLLQAVACLRHTALRRALNGWLSSHAAHAHQQDLLRMAVGKLQHRQLAMVRAASQTRLTGLWCSKLLLDIAQGLPTSDFTVG